MEKGDSTPFLELPEALVEEMLANCKSLGDNLYASFKEVQDNKKKYRERLVERSLIRKETDFGNPDIPTTCGVDGSYAIERLMAIDLVACAAVAVEGLIPPSEKRYWPKPHHIAPFIESLRHDPNTGILIGGIMWQMEIELASKAPHDIVFIDGSLTSPLIKLNPAVNKALDSRNSIASKKILKDLKDFLGSYRNILASIRNDKAWVGMPKYTTKREIGTKLGWPANYDDRAIMTTVLEAGEVIAPMCMEKPDQPWHLKIPSGDKESQLLFDDVKSSIEKLHVMYYKPHGWLPAYRFEIASSIANNNSRIALILQAIKHQCKTPSILEPYPLYMADRMVKHLHRAIPALRQTATMRMTELHPGEIAEIFFNMHGYRTESGR